MLSYKQRLNDITTFIFDVDGVFTDGKVYLINDEIVRAVNSKDGYAVQYAVKMGYKIFCITNFWFKRDKWKLEKFSYINKFKRKFKRIYFIFIKMYRRNIKSPVKRGFAALALGLGLFFVDGVFVTSGV